MVMMMVEIVVAVAYVMVVDQFYRGHCTAAMIYNDNDFHDSEDADS